MARAGANTTYGQGPAMSQAREIHPAPPFANEGGGLYRYRTRGAIEEALIPVALPSGAT